MYLDFPWQIDSRGHTATTDEADHIRDLIEQVLFTAPGERVNRPDFGCGLLQLLFEPNSDILTGATQATVQGALQRWLGDLIQVNQVIVENESMVLRITVSYLVRRTQQQQVAQFTREV